MKPEPATLQTTRYVAIAATPKQWSHSEWGESHPTMTVIEDATAPQKTGLLDASGTPLYRVTPREPIGFRVKATP